jgi:diguanylate cyclase (GGDEF)-like protein
VRWVLTRTALITVVATASSMLLVGFCCLSFDVKRPELALGLAVVITPMITAPLGIWNFRQGAKVRQLLAQLTDINSELIRVGAEFRTIARRDGLTGLLNRLAFFEAAEQASRDHGGCLIMIDADHFKSINDTHGHGAGDTALIAIADVLKTHCDEPAVTARIGGEEFAVFVPKASLDNIQLTAERIRQAIAETRHQGATAPFQLTVSLGIAGTETASELSVLYRLADNALYSAKRDGRNCVRTHKAPRAAA